MRILLLPILWFLFALVQPALAAESLQIKVDFARHGDRVLGLVSYALPSGYHSYAHRPTASGKPTELEFILETVGELPVLYPAGQVEKDIYDPAVEIYAYTGDVHLLAIGPSTSAGKMYTAELSLLLCSSRNCMPVKETLTGSVPDNLPLLSQLPWRETALALLATEGASGSSHSLEEGSLLPPRENIIQAAPERGMAGKQQPEVTGNEGNFDLGLSPRYLNEDQEIYSFGGALLLGLIAGLILNAMPCVLPVLTLKVSGLLLIGNAKSPEKARSFRLHNLCFAAGVLTFFTFLALLLGGADLIWGQIYQNEAILLFMLLLVFLMALSMLGVFVLPAFDLRIGANTKNPLLNSYFTGLVSTFLATPCSGPLLGGVLAWAFTQPMPILMAVFWSVGLGMSLPYIVFSIAPALAAILPKPGPWMGVFEKFLGFLLLATCIYLLFILPAEKRLHILIFLLIAGFCAWLWGAFAGLEAPRARRMLLGAGSAIAMAGLFVWVLMPPGPEPVWQAFSHAIFQKDLGRRNMLVEFTADWCPNCKFLEASVLTAKNLRRWQGRYQFELVRVDLTRSHPYAEDLLEQLGSRSIPLTALFGRGAEGRKPLVLRDVYGIKTLERALGEAF